MSMEIIKTVLSRFAQTCDTSTSFFGFPHWYKYLDGQGTGKECVPVFSKLSDIWLIGLAVIEMLIRVAAIAALIFVVYGGVRYILSRGNPDKITASRLTIQDAIIGLIISIVAIVFIRYIGGRIA